MSSGDDLDPTPPEGIRVPSLLGWPGMVRRTPREPAGLAERVKLLPGWRLAKQSSALQRSYEFAGQAEALRFLNFTAGLASGAGWTVDLELRGPGAHVEILAPSGQTLRAVELAAAAEVHSAARRLGAIAAASETASTAPPPEPDLLS